MEKTHHIGWKLNLLAALAVLPLTGIAVAKKPIIDYMEFPPLTRYVSHADFSVTIFIILASFILAVITPFIVRVLTARNRAVAVAETRRCFPLWGWAGILLTAVAWFMAWTRFAWFAKFQNFTFTPIWLGYIVVVNALTYMRGGRCILRDSPRYMLTLFIISAVFWWYFEYLNRFVQNWVYVGIDDISRLQYFLFATLPFSTVLPAVLSTHELLATFPRISTGMDDFIKIRIPHAKQFAWSALLISCASLLAIGIWPDYLFALLWLSPLLIITFTQTIRGEKTIFEGIASGNWRKIYLLALAALICGFFWELWNYHSLSKWEYLLPFVNRFRIFEMPILGYSGYLPFGLECALIADFVLEKRRTQAERDEKPHPA